MPRVLRVQGPPWPQLVSRVGGAQEAEEEKEEDSFARPQARGLFCLLTPSWACWLPESASGTQVLHTLRGLFLNTILGAQLSTCYW